MASVNCRAFLGRFRVAGSGSSPRSSPAPIASTAGARGPEPRARREASAEEAGLAEAAARKTGEGGATSSKVFVGNLSFETTREELQTLFAQVGEIVQVVLPSDRMTGRPRGFAFVEYSSEDHAAQAIQKFEGYEFGGRRLRVNEATDARAPRLPSAGPGRSFGAPDRPEWRPRPKGSRRNLRARKRSIW